MKAVAILLIICLISAISLSYINKITLPTRKENQRLILELAKKEVMSNNIRKKNPQVKKDRIIDNIIFYKIISDSKIVGTIAETSGKGFAADIKLLIGFNNNNIITGIKPLSHIETPGLGAKIEEINKTKGEKYKRLNPDVDLNKPWFCEQFKGKGVSKLILSKEGGSIDAITASTITSRAVTDAVRKALKVYLKN